MKNFFRMFRGAADVSVKDSEIESLKQELSKLREDNAALIQQVGDMEAQIESSEVGKYQENLSAMFARMFSEFERKIIQTDNLMDRALREGSRLRGGVPLINAPPVIGSMTELRDLFCEWRSLCDEIVSAGSPLTFEQIDALRIRMNSEKTKVV